MENGSQTQLNQENDTEMNQIQIEAKLKRTPPLLMKAGSDVKDLIHTPARKGLKRGADDSLHTMSVDMYESLMDKFSTLSNEIKSMETSVERKIDEKFNDLQGIMESTNKKLDDIEVKVEINEKWIDQNAKAINLLNQKELQNKMDVVGTKWPKKVAKEELKEEVLKVIRKYKIEIDAKVIKSAYLRTNGTTGMQIMVVEFMDFETKLKVMKDKRASKIKDGIFFDNSLTPMNGKLMGSVRKIAREKGFKTYLNNNRIHIRKSDSLVKCIESEEDIETVKSWAPNDNARHQYKSSDQSTSSAMIPDPSSA